MKTTSLNGEWQLLWNKTGEGKREELDWSQAIPCEVPGDVHQALTEKNIIGEPANGLNSKECKWLEEQEFWYRYFFEMDTDSCPESMELVFEGLDLTADIWLNDTCLGRHNNAFTRAVYSVNGLLHKGTNTIIVRIDDGVFEASKKPLEKMGEMWNNDQPYRAWMRKPQYVYGWDWTIWMPSCGIWKEVYLCERKTVSLSNPYLCENWQTQKPVEGSSIEAELQTEICRIGENTETAVSGRISNNMTRASQLECIIFSDERFEKKKELVRKVQAIQEDTLAVSMTVTIPEAKLWWPHGSGDPYLYEVQVRLLDEDGQILDICSWKHGIRKAEVVERELMQEEMEACGITTVEPGQSDRRAQKSFTFFINDTPIFCKGANHVPLNLLPGRITKEHTAAYLQEVYDCNMNMIRVWGGGIYAGEDFLGTCDGMGLMVWHDFMFACGYHPDYDAEFMDEVRMEGTQALLTARSHSSVIGWSGNNEIQEMYRSRVSWDKEFPFYGEKIYRELLPSLVSALSPNTFYRESSAYGDPLNPPNVEYGDQHIWHFTHRPQYEFYMDLWRFTDFNMKFLSEFGIAGAMNYSSSIKCISSDQLQQDSEQWLFHSNTSQEHQILNNMIDRYFGDHKQYSPERFTYLSQLLQAELTRHIFDEFQRRRFICSGLLFWTMGDSYGIHNWSLVDYYLRKKPVYYYLQQSLAPLKVVIRGYEVQNSDAKAPAQGADEQKKAGSVTTGEQYHTYFTEKPEDLELYLVNDSLSEQKAELTWQLLTTDGCVIAEKTEQVEALANASGLAARVPLMQHGISLVKEPERTVLVTKLTREGQELQRNHYFFAPYDKVIVQPAQLEVHVEEQKTESFTLRLSGDVFVWMLHMDSACELDFAENAFNLLPGEEKLVTVKGHMNSLQDISFAAMNVITFS